MRNRAWSLCAGLAATALLTSGCGELTIRTWAKIVEEESGGFVEVFGTQLPLERVQGGFLTSVVVHTDELLETMEGTVDLEDVRFAAQNDGALGTVCTWNDPAGSSGGTLTVNLLSNESVTDIFLDAKATTQLSNQIGLPPVDFEQPIDFDLGGALDPAQFLGALDAGSADGLFNSATTLAADTEVAGNPAVFSVDVVITNDSLPPLFDADILDFCGPFFDEQGTDPFYGVNSKSSYLIRHGFDQPVAPLVIDLAEVGAMAGDTLHLATVGTWAGTTIFEDGDETKLGGVFSASDEVRSSRNLNRIPGAIDAGPDLQTYPTKSCFWIFCWPVPGGNDIAEDFRIDPGLDIVVPDGASHLVVAPVDDRREWGNNSGLGFGLTIGVTPAG